MNYYNPYYMMPGMMSAARPSLFGALRGSLRGINFSSILNGTQRTLGLINQAIPLVKQVTPVVKNAKTMFRVMNEFKKTESPSQNNNNNNYNNNYNGSNNYNYYKNTEEYGEGPRFFV